MLYNWTNEDYVLYENLHESLRLMTYTSFRYQVSHIFLQRISGLDLLVKKLF